MDLQLLIQILNEEINDLKLEWQLEENPHVSMCLVRMINSLSRIKDALVDAQ